MDILAGIWITTLITWYFSPLNRIKRALGKTIFRDFLDCPMCLGFWVGAINSYILYRDIKTAVIAAFVVSFFSMALRDAYEESKLALYIFFAGVCLGYAVKLI